MLKITTAIIAILFVLHSNAQIKKGTTLLGGQIGANSNEINIINQSYPFPSPYPITQDITNKSLVIGINIGTAFKENKVIGFTFTTLSQKGTSFYTSFDTSSSKENQYQVGVFYRQYKKLAKDFYFFGQADVSAFFGKGTATYNLSTNNVTGKQTGGGLSVSTGISYAVLKKLHVELTLPNLVSLQFSNTKQTSSNPNARIQDSNQFSFNSALTSNNAIGNLGVGFRLIL